MRIAYSEGCRDDVLRQWKAMHFGMEYIHDGFSGFDSQDSLDRFTRIFGLPEDASPQDVLDTLGVAALVSNGIACHECGRMVDRVLEVPMGMY